MSPDFFDIALRVLEVIKEPYGIAIVLGITCIWLAKNLIAEKNKNEKRRENIKTMKKKKHKLERKLKHEKKRKQKSKRMCEDDKSEIINGMNNVTNIYNIDIKITALVSPD